MNIKDGIGKGFGSGEWSYSMGVNAYFVTRQTNIPHTKNNYWHVKPKFGVVYYRET